MWSKRSCFIAADLPVRLIATAIFSTASFEKL